MMPSFTPFPLVTAACTSRRMLDSEGQSPDFLVVMVHLGRGENRFHAALPQTALMTSRGMASEEMLPERRQLSIYLHDSDTPYRAGRKG